jgi:hypothetical protein
MESQDGREVLHCNIESGTKLLDTMRQLLLVGAPTTYLRVQSQGCVLAVHDY